MKKETTLLSRPVHLGKIAKVLQQEAESQTSWMKAIISTNFEEGFGALQVGEEEGGGRS